LINTQLGRDPVFQENPLPDIASIEVTQQYTNTVRVKIVGIEEVPSAKVISENGQIRVQVGSDMVANDISPVELDSPEMPVGEDQDMEAIELVVTATRSEQPLEDIPRSVTVIDQETLEEQSNLTSNLGDILGQLLPGFGPPNQSNRTNVQTLRGRDASILIDGVPQNSNASVNVQLRFIDPSSIERIEVVRGPSAIYSGEATGGVINIITCEPEAQGVNLTVDWQVDENWQIGGIFSWNEGNFENDEGEFVPLGRFDIQPLKLTAYVEHQTTPGWRNRLQALYVGDRAFDEGIDPVAIEGYFIVDYITSIQVGQGQLLFLSGQDKIRWQGKKKPKNS